MSDGYYLIGKVSFGSQSCGHILIPECMIMAVVVDSKKEKRLVR